MHWNGGIDCVCRKFEIAVLLFYEDEILRPKTGERKNDLKVQEHAQKGNGCEQRVN